MKKNILVCVTQQKNCERLIKTGHDIKGEESGEFFIVHVAHYEFKYLGVAQECEALEYLYEKALAYGANLTVVRSNSIINTLTDLVIKNRITHVVVGASGEAEDSENNVVRFLEEKLNGIAELIVVPAQ